MAAGASRYSCQIALPDFGVNGQTSLNQAKVLIIGLGGLGCPAAQYLASAGVGQLTLADHDKVSASNLHRQILFGPADVGEYKARAAYQSLKRLNADVRLTAKVMKFDLATADQSVAGYDVVVDCTDNVETHGVINDACVRAGIPVVYGAAYQHEGQAAVWNVKNSDGTFTSNYRDVWPQSDSADNSSCADGGVMPTLTAMIGSIQANETIKHLTGSGTTLADRLLIINSGSMESWTVKLGSAEIGHYRSRKPDMATVPIISTERLAKMLDEEACDLIDVRQPREHAAFNLGGRLISLDQVKAGQLVIDHNRPVIFYCRSGVRSNEAVRHALSQYPGAELYSLKGGILAWRTANRPVTKDKAVA